jgi:DNA-binding protein H-NS
MDSKDTRQLLELLKHIAASLAHLADSDYQRLQLEKEHKMTADTVNQILDLFLQVLETDASDDAAREAKLAEVQQKYDALVANDAAMNDPALQAKADEVFRKAAGAQPQEPGSGASTPPTGNEPQVNPLSNR